MGISPGDGGNGNVVSEITPEAHAENMFRSALKLGEKDVACVVMDVFGLSGINLISNPCHAMILLKLYNRVCKMAKCTPESTVVFKLKSLDATARLVATAEIFCIPLQKNIPESRHAMLTALHH